MTAKELSPLIKDRVLHWVSLSLQTNAQRRVFQYLDRYIAVSSLSSPAFSFWLQFSLSFYLSINFDPTQSLRCLDFFNKTNKQNLLQSSHNSWTPIKLVLCWGHWFAWYENSWMEKFLMRWESLQNFFHSFVWVIMIVKINKSNGKIYIYFFLSISGIEKSVDLSCSVFSSFNTC